MKLKSIINESNIGANLNNSSLPIAILLAKTSYTPPNRSGFAKIIGKLFGISDIIDYGKLNLSDIKNKKLRSIVEMVLDDLSNNPQLNLLVSKLLQDKKIIRSLTDTSIKFAEKAIDSMGPNFYWDEYYLFDKIERLKKDKPNNKFLIKHIELNEKINNIRNDMENVLKTDMYPIIKQILKQDKYSSFSEMIVSKLDDVSKSEIESIKKEYLKIILDRSNIFIKNKLQPIEFRKSNSIISTIIHNIIFQSGKPTPHEEKMAQYMSDSWSA